MADTRPERYATLALDVSGNLEIPYRLITGVDAIVQRLRIRLSFFRGEWFLNLLAGVPYYQAILGKPREDISRAVFSEVILGTPGIVRLIRLDFQPASDADRRARIWSLDFQAEASTGDIIDSKSYPQGFVIGVPT